MIVFELIRQLEEIKDKSKRVHFFNDVDWEEMKIDEILVLDDRVLLGNDIPPEKHERDYKYERG